MMYLKPSILCSLSFFTCMCATESHWIGPHEEPRIGSLKENNSNEEEIPIVPKLNGIILLGESTPLHRDVTDVRGLEVDGVKIPGDKNSLKANLDDDFINKPLTRKGLLDIKREIVKYYRYQNRPLVHVNIPEQDITAGVLQLVIYESKMGKVDPKGNRFFSEKWLKSHIKQPEGGGINVRSLNRDLTWINRNPFLQADAIFRTGSDKETTDVELIVNDRWPYRFYAGADNTGLSSTGHNRYYAGANFGNLWGCAHQFNYQFTTSTTYNEFWAHTGQYKIPLPWNHFFQIYGGYSSVDAPIRAEGDPTPFKTHGYSWQSSARYDFPLWSEIDLLQEFTLGFDFKRTNNNINLVTQPSPGGSVFVFGGAANIGQFMAGYNTGYERKEWKFNLTIEGFYQPGPLGFGDQSNEDYNSLRRFAKNHYYYFRGQFLPIIRFDRLKMFCHLDLRGQYANQNLLSSEQMSVGGYSTVRGYDERQLNGDSAIIFNGELRSKEWHFFSIDKKNRDSFQILGFYDYGIAYAHKTTSGEKHSQYIQSIGPGLRYYFNPYVTARLDLGFQLKDLEGLSHKQHHKWHFGCVASY